MTSGELLKKALSQLSLTYTTLLFFIISSVCFVHLHDRHIEKDLKWSLNVQYTVGNHLKLMANSTENLKTMLILKNDSLDYLVFSNFYIFSIAVARQTLLFEFQMCFPKVWNMLGLLSSNILDSTFLLACLFVCRMLQFCYCILAHYCLK